MKKVTEIKANHYYIKPSGFIRDTLIPFQAAEDFDNSSARPWCTIYGTLFDGCAGMNIKEDLNAGTVFEITEDEYIMRNIK